VCRRIESHFILPGTVVGVVAALIYIALTRGQPEPFAYIVAHALKVRGWCMRRLGSPTVSITVAAATDARSIHCLTSSGSQFTT
jgi:hypothetical protein